VAARVPSDRPPSLHTLRNRFEVGFVRGFIGTVQPSDSSRLPRQLRLLDFLSRPGIALATAGGVRSPRFRRDPFVRDVASDPGRASAPRIAAPHMLPSAVATASAPAISSLSWLNPTPHTITVYASPWSSPSTTQHSLPSGRYPLLGPDFRRLDRASFLAHRYSFIVMDLHHLLLAGLPAHSALPPKADSIRKSPHVRKVPNSDIPGEFHSGDIGGR
jgi:hypothetical protein